MLHQSERVHPGEGAEHEQEEVEEEVRLDRGRQEVVEEPRPLA